MARVPKPRPLNLRGTGESDSLIGSNLGDTLAGLDGSDTIVGRGGADRLSGGRGGDVFVYESFADSRASSGVDQIRDFVAGDRLDLLALGTATLKDQYDSTFSGLQAVLSFSKATNMTTLAYFSGSSSAVFQVQMAGNVTYSSDAFLGIVEQPVLPSISISDAVAGEADSTMTFTVTRSGSSDVASSVTWSVDHAETDMFDFGSYQFPTLTFAPGEATKTITILPNDDIFHEGAESFSLVLNDAINCTVVDGSGAGTLNDNDPAIPDDTTAPTITITGGNAWDNGYWVVFVADEAGMVDVFVNDVFAGRGPLVAAEQGWSFDATPQTAYSLRFVTYDAAGNSRSVDGPSLTTDAPTTYSISDAQVNENYGTITLTVTRSGSNFLSDVVRFNVTDGSALNGIDYISPHNPGQMSSLEFESGETSKTIVISLVDDIAMEGPETFEVNLLQANIGAITDSQGIATITDSDYTGGASASMAFAEPYAVRPLGSADYIF